MLLMESLYPPSGNWPEPHGVELLEHVGHYTSRASGVFTLQPSIRLAIDSSKDLIKGYLHPVQSSSICDEVFAGVGRKTFTPPWGTGANFRAIGE